MIKILALNGSPRGENGNTQVLLEAFLRGISKGEKTIETKTLFLEKLNINDCRGCFNCWSKTPGRCIFEDDMKGILKDYIEADIIIYATPLYYYGMTSILKKVIDRLLPLNKPYMVKEGNDYTHPPRYEEKSHKHILISTCGFPERHHFNNMVEHFNIIAGGKLDEAIMCTEGELLRIKEVKDICKEYIDYVEKSGFELISKGCISENTHNELKKDFVNVKTFVDMANMHWNAPGEEIPTTEKVHGQGIKEKSNIYKENIKLKNNINKMYNYIKGMAKTFNPNAAKDMKSILQIEFADIGESYYLKIENGKCDFYEGRSQNPSTIIKTPSHVWIDIGEGKLQGAKALMEGLYNVQGDFSIMMKMNEIFSSNEEKIEDEKKIERGFLSFLSPIVWLSIISFIPWYIFWFTSDSNTAISSYVPLVLSLLIFAYRKAYIEITSFDIGNIAFFAIVTVWQLFDKGSYIEYANIIGSIGIASIWCASLMSNTPITAYYSKTGYPKEIAESDLFKKVNEILTVFWVLIYLFQTVARIVVPQDMVILKNVLAYGILIVAGCFTAKFPDRYVAKLASGKK